MDLGHKNFVSCVCRHGEGALLRAKHRIVISQMKKKAQPLGIHNGFDIFGGLGGC